MRARRVTCKLCGARGSIRNKMKITKNGCEFFICMSDAAGIAAVYQSSLPRQDAPRVSPGGTRVPGSGDAERSI